MKKFRFLAVFSIAVLMLQGLYAQYEGQENFDPSDVTFEQTDGWDVATITGCYMETETGRPYLPVKHLHIAIPEDNAVASIEIITLQQQELAGTYNILPTQPGQIPGEPEPDFVNPDPGIYSVNAQYPADYIYSPTAGFMSGVHIAGLLFYPLTYNPVTQKLYLTTHLEYRLVYAVENNNPVKPRRMLINAFNSTKDEIKSYTENPSDVETYFQLEKVDDFTGEAFAPDDFPNFNGQPVEYVIITNETLSEGFQEIADWKTRTSVPAVVRTVEWIYSYYPGVDQAEKVRNFIIDAYQNWGVQYVMLGGDSEVVPIRFAWTVYDTDDFPNGHTIPADMYFACLDDNWNADGDITFGEANWDRHNDGTFERIYPNGINLDNVDRLPEIYIGRVPVEDYLVEGEPIELNRFKTKFFEYVKTSQLNANNCLLFSSMGSIASLKNAFPAYVNFTERYNTGGYNNMDVLAEFNGTAPNGVKHHIICGLGHGGPTSFAAAEGSLNRTHMDGLVNSDRSQILYLANHCTTMPWDKNTVTEHYFNSENGGVAVIANTAVGWTIMVSEYNYPFIHKIYYDDQIIGRSFKETKILYNNNSLSDGRQRVIFFSLSLASDPELPVWTDSPDPQNPLIVDVPANVYTGGQTVQVVIDNLASGVEAMVCLFKEGEIYAREPVTGTGSTVTVNLACTPNTTGDILVTVTAQNYLPVETVIPVTYNPGIHLFASELTIDDDGTSPSNGNDDGLVDEGETIEMYVTLTNNGLTGATNVTAGLTYVDPNNNGYITISGGQASFGSIASLGSGVSLSPYVFSVSSNAPDQFLVAFALSITDGQNSYQDEIYLEIHAPEPELISNIISTTINNDNIIDPGDHVLVTFEFFNGGSGMATGLTGELNSTSPYVVTINPSVQSFGNIAAHTSGSNQNAFGFDVTNNYNNETIEMTLTLTDEYGKEWEIPVDFDKPQDITTILWESSDVSITLYWDPITDEKGYNIYRSDSEEGNFVKLNSQIITGFSGYTDYGLTPKTIYYYKVSCVSYSGIEGNLSAPQETWTSLPYHADWPNKAINTDDFGGRTEGSPMTVDFDGDGDKEIYLTMSDGVAEHCTVGGIFGFYDDGEEIYDIDQNPTLYGGFYKYNSAGSRATPAIGDLDLDNVLELVTTTKGEDNTNDRRKVFVHSTVGEEIPELLWSSSVSGPDFKGVVLSDIDYNGDLEIITKGGWGSPIYVFNHDNSNFSGWPLSISETGYGMPAAENIDNTGNKELIFCFESGIYVFNHDAGSYLSGQNGLFYHNGPSPGIYDRMDSPVTIADIDQDVNGYKEIVCVSGRDATGRVFILNYLGQTITGWDYDDHTFNLTNTVEGKSWLPVTSVADLNGDGDLEVLIASDEYIYIWNKDGSEFIDPIYVQALETKYIAPLIADVDEDNDLEIIVASNSGFGAIHCYDIDGNRVLGWPIKLPGIFSTPCIDDIDNDGKNEIIATSGNEIHVWETDCDADKIEWGKYRHDSYNSGIYGNSCLNNSDPVTITGVTEWTENHMMQGNIIIEQGGELTISGNVALPDDAKIIVKPGAELVLDGCKLTRGCTGNWQGIEVWGDPLLSQIPSNQGTLEIVHGATIENASVAVRLGSKDYANKGGGMIFAADAIFRNNHTGIKFETYSFGNLSYFERCTFETTAELPDSQTPQYFVMMTSVDGVALKGCTFRNTCPNSVAYADRGIGIYSVNSVFTVDKICISGTTPCTEYRYPEFNNLNYAIKALATSSNTPWYIREGQFTDNRRGVYISGISSATFTNNIIHMSLEQFEGVTNDTIYGAYFDGCTGYTFYENQSISDYDQLSGEIALGLVINNSGPDNNLVYDNYFENVYTATLVQGQNRNNGGSTGLVIKCNEFVNTLYDEVITFPGLFSTVYMGIALHQGSNSLNNPDMAGNRFYYNNISRDYDDINNKANLFYYYYPANTSVNGLEPIDYTSNKVTKVPKTNTPSWTIENGCPQASSPGGGETESLFLQMDEATQQIDSTLNILSMLIDSGDTESLQDEVETSTSSSSMQVYNELMSTSPYLSDTVVSTAIGKEDVLPNAMLRDVLVANPNTAKSDELLSKLDSRWDPMPDYMKAQILQGRSIVSLREETEANLSAYRLRKSVVFYGLVNHYIAEAGFDSLALLFASDNTLSSKYRLAFIYLEKGEVSEGYDVLNAIPSQFELTSEDFTSYEAIVDYYDLLAAIQPGNIIPDSTQLTQIRNISSIGTGNASVYARNVLLALDRISYNEPLLLPDLYKSAEAFDTYENLLNTDGPPSLKVYPNPSKDYVIIAFMTDITKNSLLEIDDSNGKVIKHIQLQNNHDQSVIDTRGWRPGIYIVTCKTGSKSTESCKFSIVR